MRDALLFVLIMLGLLIAAVLIAGQLGLPPEGPAGPAANIGVMFP